ncbi:MAG: signal peptidase I [Clostridia bacterium]|nr:signal peptidase I [Clostridia bacterium]
MEENKNLNGENLSVDEAVETVLQESGEQQPDTPKKKSWKQEVREWVISIAVALLVVFVVRTFLFQIIRVDGDSMSTTLLDGERLFVTVADVKLNGVERGDIVICHYPNRGKTNFVKRVVAMPGDQVYREFGVTHVVYETTDENGETITVDEMMDERWALYFIGGSTDDYAPYTLGEDEYFVVGDNRYNSHDSRDWNDSSSSNDVGPITGDMIVGKVHSVIWPLSEIRIPE